MGFKVHIELNFEDATHPPTQEDVHEYLDQIMMDDEGIKFEIVLPRRENYPDLIGWTMAGEIIENYGGSYAPVFSNDPDAPHALAIAGFDPSSRRTRVFNAIGGSFSTNEVFAWVNSPQFGK